MALHIGLVEGGLSLWLSWSLWSDELICDFPLVTKSSHFAPASNFSQERTQPPNHTYTRSFPKACEELGSALAILGPNNFMVFQNSSLALTVHFLLRVLVAFPLSTLDYFNPCLEDVRLGHLWPDSSSPVLVSCLSTVAVYGVRSRAFERLGPVLSWPVCLWWWDSLWPFGACTVWDYEIRGLRLLFSDLGGGENHQGISGYMKVFFCCP